MAKEVEQYLEYSEPTVELVVKYLNVEYADCGSHRLRVSLTADREELAELQKTLKKLLQESKDE